MNHPQGAAVRSSLRLSLLTTVSSGVLQFGVMVALARLLTPADYGAYVLCVALVALSAGFPNSVIERFLVVRPSEDRKVDESPSIAVLSLGAGAVAFAVGEALNIYHPGMVDLGVLLLVVASACISSWAVVPRAALRRQICFGPIVAAELTGLLVGPAITAMALAAAGWGAYALAAGACVQSAIVALAMRWRVPHAPFVPFTPRHVTRLVRSAIAAGGNSAAEVASGQIAPLIIGSCLGRAALGLFNRAYSLVQMPVQLMVASISRVMISALHSVSDDVEELRSAAQILVRTTAVVAMPFAAGIAGAGHNLVLVVLGEGWSVAASIMPALALGACARMMGSTFGIIAEARGAFSAKAKTQVLSSAVLALLASLGVQAELGGAVWGIATGCCVLLLLYARLAARLLDLPLSALLSWLAPGVVTALPCFAVSLALDRFLSGAPAAVLTMQVVGCGLAASGTMIALYPTLALRIIEVSIPALLRLPRLGPYLRKSAGTSKV